jgi:hypothetical protein
VPDYSFALDAPVLFRSAPRRAVPWLSNSVPAFVEAHQDTTLTVQDLISSASVTISSLGIEMQRD